MISRLELSNRTQHVEDELASRGAGIHQVHNPQGSLLGLDEQVEAEGDQRGIRLQAVSTCMLAAGSDMNVRLCSDHLGREGGDAPHVTYLAAPAAYHRRDAGSELDSSAVVELRL